MAAACADVSKNKESGSFLRPALRDVGAFCALADGMQPFLFQGVGYAKEIFIRGKFDFEPRRFFYFLYFLKRQLNS